MLGELIPLAGGDPIPLLKPRLLIGRRSSCDITLEFPNVSSHHCELEFLNGYWRVRDLGSTNGVKVNGERLDDPKWVQPGDTITVAKHGFEIAYTPDPNIAPPEDDNPFERSLLEKAGLERRRERPSRPSSQADSPPRSRPPSPRQRSADDDVVDWLNEP